MAVGFEPTVRLPPHALSRRAPLAARTRHRGGDYKDCACTKGAASAAPFELAEDRGFEPLRAINPTRFPSERHRPLGESSAGDITRQWRVASHAPYPGNRPPVRCQLAQPPQGRKAARVGGLCQVRGGSRLLGIRVRLCHWPSIAPTGLPGWQMWSAKNTSQPRSPVPSRTTVCTMPTCSPGRAGAARPPPRASWPGP